MIIFNTIAKNNYKEYSNINNKISKDKDITSLVIAKYFLTKSCVKLYD